MSRRNVYDWLAKTEARARVQLEGMENHVRAHRDVIDYVIFGTEDGREHIARAAHLHPSDVFVVDT